MNAFNTIVLTIAVIFLILILTSVGIIMLYTNNNSLVYPPTSSTCPDYWTFTPSSTGGKCMSRGFNEGTVTKSGPVVGAPGGFSFNPTDAAFNERGITQTCGQKRWAIANKVEWDGVSNYNKCSIK
jgi:hypothetical protein